MKKILKAHPPPKKKRKNNAKQDAEVRGCALGAAVARDSIVVSIQWSTFCCKEPPPCPYICLDRNPTKGVTCPQYPS